MCIITACKICKFDQLILLICGHVQWFLVLSRGFLQSTHELAELGSLRAVALQQLLCARLDLDDGDVDLVVVVCVGQSAGVDVDLAHLDRLLVLLIQLLQQCMQ